MTRKIWFFLWYLTRWILGLCAMLWIITGLTWNAVALLVVMVLGTVLGISLGIIDYSNAFPTRGRIAHAYSNYTSLLFRLDEEMRRQFPIGSIVILKDNPTARRVVGYMEDTLYKNEPRFDAYLKLSLVGREEIQPVSNVALTVKIGGKKGIEYSTS